MALFSTKLVSLHPQRGHWHFFRRTISAQLHLTACVAAIAGSIVLVTRSLHHSHYNHVLATLIFGITSIFLFATSTIYHFLYDGLRISAEFEAWFEKLDHTAIYLFIAGTYTPFVINTVGNPWANILLVMVWFVAIMGLVYTYFKNYFPQWVRGRYLYTAGFVAMGFLFTFRAGEIFRNLSNTSTVLFVLGACSYTLGAVIYATKWPNLFKNVFGFHELWHLLVIFGYGFHFFLILNFY